MEADGSPQIGRTLPGSDGTEQLPDPLRSDGKRYRLNQEEKKSDLSD